jgi:hypothetical protein
MHENTTRPTADLSRERRRQVHRLLKRTGVVHDPRLSTDAKVLYVVGALICDQQGAGSTEVLMAAMQDPSIVQAARTILAKAVAS